MERDFLGLSESSSSSQNLNQITTNNTVNNSVSSMQWWRSEYPCGSTTSSEFQPSKATEHRALASPLAPYANLSYDHYNSKPVSTLSSKMQSNFYHQPWKFPNFQQDETVAISNYNNNINHGTGAAGFPSSSSAVAPPTDPIRNKSNQIIAEAVPDDHEGRLTIIYDNEVYVFDDMTPDKVEAVMRLAKEKYYSCFAADHHQDDTKQVAEAEAEAEPPSGTSSIINPTMPNNFPASTPSTENARNSIYPTGGKATNWEQEHFMEKRKGPIDRRHVLRFS